MSTLHIVQYTYSIFRSIDFMINRLQHAMFGIPAHAADEFRTEEVRKSDLDKFV